MHSWKTFGHETVKTILDKQINGGSLAHAYLFSGPVGIGKKTLALEFARVVLGVENLSNHPDFQILDGENEITAESAVEFIRSLAFKPFIAAKKVAIVNNAQNLNIQSSNALLKTLEEPSESTIIILIAGEGRLLPTIVSRCQSFHFQTFSKNKLQEFADIEKLKVDEKMLELSFGKISRLKNLVESKEFFQTEEEIIEKYQTLQKYSSGEKLLAVGEYAELETVDLERDFLTWLNWQTQNLDAKSVGKLDALLVALESLRSNFNKKLVLQNLFLKI